MMQAEQQHQAEEHVQEEDMEEVRSGSFLTPFHPFYPSID
jgi:hypothetical protein